MAEAEAAYEASEPSKDVSSHPDAKAEAPKLQYAELVTYLELRQASKSTVYSIPLALYATYHSDACAREVTIWYYLLFGVGALGVFIGLAQLCRKRPRGGGDAERSGDALTARLWTGLQRLGEPAAC